MNFFFGWFSSNNEITNTFILYASEIEKSIQKNIYVHSGSAVIESRNFIATYNSFHFLSFIFNIHVGLLFIFFSIVFVIHTKYATHIFWHWFFYYSVAQSLATYSNVYLINPEKCAFSSRKPVFILVQYQKANTEPNATTQWMHIA